ncbi:uncharacterized protein LOC131229496 [Magnolia sinica]|uniref:uncharacterized protein LOC131229496 n=1 Tax=Magnolia sinica TaxID=86752 RepID=UPI002659A129|nr:uncharacterized protein LOC131229496 [Magnolia sinica]
MASQQREEEALRKRALLRCSSHAHDELQSFRSCLRWLCVDQSDPWHAFISWTVFVLFAIIVPSLSHFVLSCPGCHGKHRRPYDIVNQVSLTVIATLSYFCLSRFVRNYGLRRFLFLDRLCDESEKVRQCYMMQLNRSFHLLSVFVVPCFAAESAYKIWWYASGASQIPFLGNVYVSDAIACILELCSWLYRTSIYFLVCVLFRLICHLQILRLQDFTQVFQEESDVALVLKEHLRIRTHLKVISHRYRAFILCALVFVTASQLASLLIVTKSHADANIFRAGELALCSVGLVTGLFICLRSATKITHKAQGITSHAAKWHVCATIDSFDTMDNETPTQVPSRPSDFSAAADSDEEVGSDDDDAVDTKMVLPHSRTISFQKRQALVTYFENNRAGITVFGFTMDRTYLHTIFGIEMSLFLWLLGKTVGI